MKRYIKPNTQVQKIELVQMIAASGHEEQVETQGNLGGGSGFTFGSKESDFSSNDLWSSDEEE